ncbi:MAG: hypothetical protein WCQ21_28710, partial [Verrucomicrobiota bacterium]
MNEWLEVKIRGGITGLAGPVKEYHNQSNGCCRAQPEKPSPFQPNRGYRVQPEPRLPLPQDLRYSSVWFRRHRPVWRFQTTC